MGPRIVVVGGGPTGLGAALRMTDLGHEDWTLIDCADCTGGLSRSFVDDAGFTWDLGGHVIFSHYAYFDDAMDYAVQDWNTLERESWVWVAGVWVPYPFQNNIHRLPNDVKEKCFEGLLDVYRASFDGPPQNFEEYFSRQFGAGIADVFMRPYNYKVWAVPPVMMSTEWTGERVATVDIKRVAKNVIHNQDDLGWGPNATFRFPQRGGTGGIWTSLASKLPQEKFMVGPENQVVAVDATKKVIKLKSGKEIEYDHLISTMPFDDLIPCVTNIPSSVSTEGWKEVSETMIYSATNVIGLGMKGGAPPHLRTKCWMYFPEDSSPFYRCTVFSNYAKANAPEGHWSLMLEVSENADHKPVNQETLIEDCIRGCLASNLLTPQDEIVSKWHKRLSKGYPTPFVGRNAKLDVVQPGLRSMNIWSRGRFGGWKYEVANQDHSMMQGVECVEEILGVGEEITYHKPSVVNAKKEMTRRLGLLKKKE